MLLTGAIEGKAALDLLAASFTKLDSVAARSTGGPTRISGTQSRLAGSLNQSNVTDKVLIGVLYLCALIVNFKIE